VLLRDPRVVAGVDATDASGRTALRVAGAARHWGVVRLLVDAGADPVAVQHGWPGPLRLASECGDGAAVEYLLLDARVTRSIDVADNRLETALVSACRGGHDQVVKLLLGAGADPNVFAEHPALGLACLKGHSEVARMLIQAGADTTALDYLHRTPLVLATEGGHAACVALLQVRRCVHTRVCPDVTRPSWQEEERRLFFHKALESLNAAAERRKSLSVTLSRVGRRTRSGAGETGAVLQCAFDMNPDLFNGDACFSGLNPSPLSDKSNSYS
jgi:ankyrin repeat protein